MGGNAFENLSPTAFPRLPSQLYQLLKARWLPRLQELYKHVAVPAETPEKNDHGDLDFVVAGPKVIGAGDEARQVTHEDVKEVLQAVDVVPLGANRTSNFAVPITSEWLAQGGTMKEAQANEIYCQVDIHVCADEGEWDRIVFFHGFGDLGMILGLIARNCGLALGTKGLKIRTQSANRRFDLSSSIPLILEFFGLSMDTWKNGFPTQQAVFEWAASSRFFDPRFRKDRKDGSKRKEMGKRDMYNNFRAWAQDEPRDESKGEWTRQTVVAEALIFFDKKSEYDTWVEEHRRLEMMQESEKRLKSTFNGTVVKEWTGLPHLKVKKVMDRTREKLGGENTMLGMGMDEIRKAVQEAAEELGFEVNELTVEIGKMDVKDHAASKE